MSMTPTLGAPMELWVRQHGPDGPRFGPWLQVQVAEGRLTRDEATAHWHLHRGDTPAPVFEDHA